MSAISPLYGNVKLYCTITSDIHIDIKHPMPWLPKYILKQSLKDSQNAAKKADAYISVGDTTSRGSDINWEMAKSCFKKYSPAKNILLAVGNHDLWGDDEFPEIIARFCRKVNDICGGSRETTYFSALLNGYKLIFLGSDDDAGCEAQISDEQMEWFKKEMAEGGATGKPIFVFCHQSLNGRHGLPRTWDRHEKPDRAPDEGGIGARSDEVAAILKQYKNVFYFSGHSHMGLGGENCLLSEGYSTFEQEDGVTLINLPSLSNGNHHGETPEIGMGVMLEVYEHRVVIRPRSFLKHRWNKSIIIKDGKPYFECII